MRCRAMTIPLQRCVRRRRRTRKATERHRIEPVTFVALLGEDGVYVFDSVELRTVFGRSVLLQVSVEGLGEVTLEVAADLCETSQRAVEGTFRCEVCPANALCDGTSLIGAPPGYWRAWPRSSEVYECSVTSACAGDATCTGGYRGLLCQDCAPGYGLTGATCEACFSKPVNVLLTILLVLAALLVTTYLSIGSMTARDVAQIGKQSDDGGDRWSAVSIVLKLGITHLQIVGLLPAVELGFPSWVQLVTGGAGRGSQASARFSFIGCLVADDAIAILEVQVVGLAILILCIGIVALSVATWDAMGSAGRGFGLLAETRAHTKSVYQRFQLRRRASLGQRQMFRGHAMHDSVVRTAEVVVADDDEHWHELHRNHRVLLDDDDNEYDDAVAGPVDDEDDAPVDSLSDEEKNDEEDLPDEKDDDDDNEHSNSKRNKREGGGEVTALVLPSYNETEGGKKVVFSTPPPNNVIVRTRHRHPQEQEQQQEQAASRRPSSTTRRREHHTGTARFVSLFGGHHDDEADDVEQDPMKIKQQQQDRPSFSHPPEWTPLRRSSSSRSKPLPPPSDAKSEDISIWDATSTWRGALFVPHHPHLEQQQRRRSHRLDDSLRPFAKGAQEDEQRSRRLSTSQFGGRPPPRRSLLATSLSILTNPSTAAGAAVIDRSDHNGNIITVLSHHPSYSIEDPEEDEEADNNNNYFAHSSRRRRDSSNQAAAAAVLGGSRRRASLKRVEALELSRYHHRQGSRPFHLSLDEDDDDEKEVEASVHNDNEACKKTKTTTIRRKSSTTSSSSSWSAAARRRDSHRHNEDDDDNNKDDEYEEEDRGVPLERRPSLPLLMDAASEGRLLHAATVGIGRTTTTLPSSSRATRRTVRVLEGDQEEAMFATYRTRDKHRRQQRQRPVSFVEVDEDGERRSGGPSIRLRTVLPFVVTRFVNMSVAGAVCALFLLYPAVVQSAASLLDCRSVETPQGVFSVVRGDSSVLCEGSRYERARVGAWLVLVLVGLGGPLLSGLAVLALRRYTCDGSLTAARMIMHFMTGGYRAGAWYWECIVMCRKLSLVVCITLLGGGMSSLLGCLWTLGVALYLTLTIHQFDNNALLYMDVISLSLTAVMFGVASVATALRSSSSTTTATSMYAVATSWDYQAVLGALTGALQILALSAFAFLLLWMLGKEVRSLMRNMGSRVIVGLCGWLVGDLTVRNESLELEAAQRLRTLQYTHERYFETLVAEHYAEELLVEMYYELERLDLAGLVLFGAPQEQQQQQRSRSTTQHSESSITTTSHFHPLPLPPPLRSHHHHQHGQKGCSSTSVPAWSSASAVSGGFGGVSSGGVDHGDDSDASCFFPVPVRAAGRGGDRGDDLHGPLAPATFFMMPAAGRGEALENSGYFFDFDNSTGRGGGGAPVQLFPPPHAMILRAAAANNNNNNNAKHSGRGGSGADNIGTSAPGQSSETPSSHLPQQQQEEEEERRVSSESKPSSSWTSHKRHSAGRAGKVDPWLLEKTNNNNNYRMPSNRSSITWKHNNAAHSDDTGPSPIIASVGRGLKRVSEQSSSSSSVTSLRLIAPTAERTDNNHASAASSSSLLPPPQQQHQQQQLVAVVDPLRSPFHPPPLRNGSSSSWASRPAARSRFHSESSSHHPPQRRPGGGGGAEVEEKEEGPSPSAKALSVGSIALSVPSRNPLLRGVFRHHNRRQQQQQNFWDEWGVSAAEEEEGEGVTTVPQLQQAVLELEEALAVLRRVWDWLWVVVGSERPVVHALYRWWVTRMRNNTTGEREKNEEASSNGASSPPPPPPGGTPNPLKPVDNNFPSSSLASSCMSLPFPAKSAAASQSPPPIILNTALQTTTTTTSAPHQDLHDADDDNASRRSPAKHERGNEKEEGEQQQAQGDALLWSGMDPAVESALNEVFAAEKALLSALLRCERRWINFPESSW